MKPDKVDRKIDKEEHNINLEINNNKLLTDILESSSSVSIISTDINQNILYWNTGAENIFGYKASEVVGKMKVTIIYDGAESKRNALKAKKLIISTKKGTECELKQITKSGMKLWSRMTLSPRFDENGEVVGILGIGIDITKHKKLLR